MQKKYVSKDDAIIKLQRYCVYQERCHKEVRQRIRDWGIYGDDIDDIILHLIQHNYLNELRFAKQYTSGKFRIKKWGRFRIRRELKQRQISDYCIKKAMAEIDEGEYLETLHKLFSKRLKVINMPNEFQTNGNLAKYAMDKGFEAHIVWREVKLRAEYAEDMEDEDFEVEDDDEDEDV